MGILILCSRTLAVSFVILAFSLPAIADSAADCGTKDFRDSVPELRNYAEGKSFFQVASDADDSNWCYSFVAADLFTYELRRPISAVALSALFNKYLDDVKHRAHSGIKEFGWIQKALQLARDEGACLESSVPSNSVFLAGKRALNNDAQVSKLIQDAGERLAGLRENLRNGGKKDGLIQQDEVCQDLAQLLPNLSIPDIGDILARTLEMDINDAFYELVHASCLKGGSLMDLLQGISVQAYGKNDIPAEFPTMTAGIDQALDGANKPVGINFNYHILSSLFGKEDAHAVTVVGRKMIGGKCQYLLRNNAGKNCAWYDPELRSGCDAEEGTVWVPRDRLEKGLNGFVFLQKGGKDTDFKYILHVLPGRSLAWWSDK